MTDKKNLIIIDGNSLINRAYYAIQRPMMTKDGTYTQGIYGFLTMLNKILTDHKADYIAVAWDRKAPTFRHEEYKEYKAGRKKMPMELAMQLPIMKDVLSAMNIKMLEIDGFEADDIIGTVAKEAESKSIETLIITGDKDELQLASKDIKVLITKKGISEFEIYDDDAMMEKYGFSPTQFIDYKGLMGDQSDNIPGLPGVGEKTADKLIKQFGSVENMLENADQIENAKLRAKVEENAQLAVMSKRLATIHTEVPIDLDFDEYKYEAPDYKRLMELYSKLEFNSFLKKLNVESDIELEEPLSSKRPEPKDIPKNLISESSELVDAFKGIKEEDDIYLKIFSDNSHVNYPEIYGISMLHEDSYHYIHGSDHETINEFAQKIHDLKLLLKGHELQKSLYALNATFKRSHKEFYDIFDPVIAFDSSISQYLLDPTRNNYSLKTMVMEYFGEDFLEEKDFEKQNSQMDMLTDNTRVYSDYGYEWCLAVKHLEPVLDEKITELKLDKVLCEVELPLVKPLVDMEVWGFRLEKETLLEVGKGISERIDILTREIYEISGEEFNINSPAQLGVVLFEKMGLPPSKKTKTGYSTSADVLEKLKEDSPIIEKILEYRTVTKLKGTYIDGLIPLIHEDGKIHAHFQQTVTATGRISCTEPNLQNIPIRQELGRSIRKAFVPETDDYVLTGADYSQIELRILADLSGDESLIKDFNDGADIHRRTASRVFNVPEDEVTDLQRSRAKAVNFGIIYGQSGFGLSEGLGITMKDARKYIDDYFEKHPAVKQYLDLSVAEGKANGYVTTVMGRRRDIPEINASNFMVRQAGERLAMNSPIQGSAADIMKLAMINVYERLRKEGFTSRVILQVHDELIIETLKSELEEVKVLLKEEMEKAYKLNVPVTAEVSTGGNWFDLK